MSRNVLALIAILALTSAASAEITDVCVERIYDGLLLEYWPPTQVFSYDLKVEIAGDDAWTVAGGSAVGDPWITYNDGVFYQHPIFDFNPPDPVLFAPYPDLVYDSFYTTHLGWPNTEHQGVSPGFAFGPADTDHALVADWFCVPDGSDYPGDYTIARFTVIPDDPTALTYAHIDMLVGSQETVPPIPFEAYVPIPEAGSLALLAFGGLALLRRR